MSYALGQGRRRGRSGAWRSRRRGLSIAAGLPVAVLGWLAAPPAIERFFPQYVASVPAVRWSLVAGVLWGLTSLTTLFGSLKAWRSLALYIGVLLAARWTLPWLLSSRYEPLVGVARGNACAAAVVGGLSLVLAVRAMRRPRRRSACACCERRRRDLSAVTWDPPLARPQASEQAVFALGKLCLLAFLAAQFLSLTRLFFSQHLGDGVTAVASVAGIASVALLLPAVLIYGLQAEGPLGNLVRRGAALGRPGRGARVRPVPLRLDGQGLPGERRRARPVPLPRDRLRGRARIELPGPRGPGPAAARAPPGGARGECPGHDPDDRRRDGGLRRGPRGHRESSPIARRARSRSGLFSSSPRARGARARRSSSTRRCSSSSPSRSCSRSGAPPFASCSSCSCSWSCSRASRDARSPRNGHRGWVTFATAGALALVVALCVAPWLFEGQLAGLLNRLSGQRYSGGAAGHADVGERALLRGRHVPADRCEPQELVLGRGFGGYFVPDTPGWGVYMEDLQRDRPSPAPRRGR